MAAETNGDGSPVNAGGVYRHPDTNQELVFQANGKFGNPGADAAVRLGFVFVGPAKLAERNADGPAGTLYAGVDPNAGPTANTAPVQSIANLETELALTRGRLAAAEKAAKANSSLVDKEAQKASGPQAPTKKEKGAK